MGNKRKRNLEEEDEECKDKKQYFTENEYRSLLSYENMNDGPYEAVNGRENERTWRNCGEGNINAGDDGDIVLNSVFPARPQPYGCYAHVQTKISLVLKTDYVLDCFEERSVATSCLISEPITDYCLRVTQADNLAVFNCHFSNCRDTFVYNNHQGRVYLKIFNAGDKKIKIKRGLTIAFLYFIPYEIK